MISDDLVFSWVKDTVNDLSILQLVPVEHFDVLVRVLIELSDAAVDVLGNAVVARFEDGLLDCFF